MKFFIDSSALERLVDPDVNVREKALNEITSILRNNILFEAAASQGNNRANEELEVVNLAELTRQLIRWFIFRPIIKSDEILDLLILILSRKDFLRYITKSISVQRLKKEMIKIAKMRLPESGALKLVTIDQLLSDFESETLVNVASETGSIAPVGSPKRDEINSSLLDHFNRLQIASSDNTVAVSCDDAIEVANECWIRLRGKELDVFNKLDEELLLYNNQEAFKKALNFLRVSIEDFPSEYFLQPPNILETLMDILWKVPNESGIEIVQIIKFIINGLRNRWLDASSKRADYIPTKKHMNKILQMFTIFFEHFHREFDHKLVADKQEILNQIFMLLFDFVEFIRDSQEFCETFLNELMNMLANVVKDFRLADTHTSLNCRLNYLVGLYLINAFLASTDISNVIQFSQNNVWEYECDIALLDFKLKSTHAEIYNLILRNRYDVIKDDTDLELLLNIETVWNPAIQVYQNHDVLSEKYIIENASYTMDVIRVLKNPKFVDVVFNAIVNSSYRFHVDPSTSQTSNEIFLRLISIDDPEIKLRTYSLARESIQKRISEDCNDPNLKDVDLCAVVGIPLNTEIITEIICFGLLDDNLEIQKHATMILYALLRGKVIFPNHWENILEIMRPVLAMLPCLFSKEPKLGFFAFDIYNQHSGFTRDELNQAYARFLFCSHPNAREMAKRKLLENLKAYSNDFIEIVPDNFCILPDGLITALPIPDKNIGYDREAYATTAKLLKSTSTHNDPEMLQSILLQLSVLMNSAKLCEKAHDENLWIYFMASLDMNFPDNPIIRKLTINILYKWTVTVPYFRIYLSNEPKALHFIINTLIYYQDDPQIQKQASSFLFLILFSDFVVVNENVTSLPNILGTLECPFRFSKHWEESPFNKISQIEWLYDSMEHDENRDSDIREITQKYFRFTFANAWFQSDFNGCSENSYYQDKFKSALKVPEKIMLAKKDFESLKESAVPHIVDTFVNNLANITNTSEMKVLIQQIICALMIPNMKIERFSLTLDAQLRGHLCYKKNSSDPRKFMFVKLMELYQHIVPSLSDTKIVNMMREQPIESIIMSTELLEDVEVTMPILRLINSVIKISTKRKDLANKIIKRYNDDLKVYFPSRLIEKLIVHVFENYVKTRMLNDVRALPAVKTILTTIKNIFTYFPVILDEQFINSTFKEMLAATKFFLSTPRTDNDFETTRHSSTNVAYLMHAIIERLCALSCHINLKPDNFNVIFLWLSDQERRNNALMWKIVAQLMKRNLHFNEFCKGFDESMKMSFYDVVTQAIASSERIFCSHVKDAQALVVGNFLDYICEENAREIGFKNSRKTAMEIKQDIATLFIDKKPHSIDAICFLVKKMVKSQKSFDVEEMVKQKKLVDFLLKNSIENLDTVVVCYKFKGLERHVHDSLCSMKDETLYQLIANIKCPYDKCSQKKVNKNLLSIILILLQSKDGHEKACKAITKDQKTFNNFIMNISDGLQSENAFSEIMYQFELISSLLNFDNDFFSSDVSTLVCGNKLNKIAENLEKPENSKAEKFVKNNLKLVQFAVDLVVVQIVALYESLDVMRFNSENVYDMRAQIFLVLKKIMSSSEQARIIASKIDLMGIVLNRVKVIVQSIGSTTRIEMNKKSGVQKCQFISKDLCINLKAIVEWNLASEDTEKVEEFLSKILNVYGWIYNDTLLLNAFVNFLQFFESLRFAKICLVKEHNGKTVLKGILKKAFELSSNPQHTDANLELLKNILNLFSTYANVIDVRLMLKNASIFQILDVLHPQLQKSRKTTWNEVILVWLKFFEKLSLIEDPECNPSQISLFCRLIRTDDKEIGKTTLKVIRNVSMKSLHGYAILQSNDFLETVSSILCDDCKNENEKILILQTLLGLASKSEQMRSKLKNSSFSRKLKEYLSSLQVNENLQIFNLTTMLSDILYPQ